MGVGVGTATHENQTSRNNIKKKRLSFFIAHVSRYLRLKLIFLKVLDQRSCLELAAEGLEFAAQCRALPPRVQQVFLGQLEPPLRVVEFVAKLASLPSKGGNDGEISVIFFWNGQSPSAQMTTIRASQAETNRPQDLATPSFSYPLFHTHTHITSHHITSHHITSHQPGCG